MPSIPTNIHTLRIGKIFGTLFIGLCLAAIALGIALPYGSSAADDSIVIKPEADTYARSDAPTKNYGGASHLDIQGTPQMRSLLRFTVSGLGQNSVAQARLRLYVSDASSQAGVKVFATDPAWDEKRVTWIKQPKLGAQVAELAPASVAANTWIEIDLGQAVTGDGVYSFALTSETTDLLAFRSRSQAEAPELKLYQPALSKPVPPTATPAPTGKVKILCENKVYDGYTSKLFVLETAEDQDPSIQKVIRNCTFRNGSAPALVLRSARNVLVEGSTFENIRSNQPGVGVHAINIPCRAPCVIDNVIIRNNHFSMIGADGIQLGEEDRNISNVRIENNTFVGREGSGENGVDVKGVNGPIYIVGNVIHGFRPCVSPKQGGTQDCSGSIGAGMVIHEGVPAGRANNVTVEGNEFYDNTDGLHVTVSDNIVVKNNSFHDNLEYGLLASGVNKLTISGNTFTNNGINMQIQESTDCSATSNTFSGSGGTGSFGTCAR
jgi:parallel beta-helix repeat protein